MTRVRVLVVDDSAVIRRMLSDVLGADPDIEVVGTAANGEIALERIDTLKPDVVTLDVEMPGMSGLDALIEIRKRARKLPVIMFSSLTQRAASTTLEALARGATDYVTKPSNTGSREASLEHVRLQLVPKVKGLATIARAHAVPMKPRTVVAKKLAGSRVEILAVASSTGGPNALADLLRGFEQPLPVPTLIVQHMPPLFTRILAERLAATSKLQVHEATHGMPLEAGHVYLAPGDYHMTVAREGRDVRVALEQGPPENSCRPAADVMYRSVASVYGGNTLAVVLTGMGQDGLHGIEQLRATGAQVVVQDEATSVVWGMPGIIATHGLADQILPLEEIAGAIVKRIGVRDERRVHAG